MDVPRPPRATISALDGQNSRKSGDLPCSIPSNSGPTTAISASTGFRQPTPDETSEPASATAIDGTWTTSFTKGELADSPLLTDPEELNDQNWGDFTFLFDAGAFSFNQSNKKAEYASSGTFTVEGDVVRLDLDNGEKFAVRYSIHGAKLRFEPDESLGVAPTPYVLKPWTRTQAG